MESRSEKGGGVAAPRTPKPAKVRMVRCMYALPGEDPWVPMGRARSRRPRCGAGLDGNDAHPVELREVKA